MQRLFTVWIITTRQDDYRKLQLLDEYSVAIVDWKNLVCYFILLNIVLDSTTYTWDVVY